MSINKLSLIEKIGIISSSIFAIVQLISFVNNGLPNMPTQQPEQVHINKQLTPSINADIDTANDDSTMSVTSITTGDKSPVIIGNGNVIVTIE